MNAPEQKNGSIWNLLTVFLVGVAILYVTSFLVNKTGIVGGQNNPNATQVASSTQTASTPTPYAEKNLMNSKVIVDNFSNSAPNLKPTATNITKLTVTGQIANGYLYVVASANGKALQSSDPGNYDDVYANLIQLTNEGSEASRNHGGHLVASASLETPQSSNQTELLYSLSSVGYINSYRDTNGKLISPEDIIWSNWLSVLNQTSHQDELEVYSSTEKTGTIEKLIIYYNCVKGSDCSINTSSISS